MRNETIVRFFRLPLEQWLPRKFYQTDADLWTDHMIHEQTIVVDLTIDGEALKRLYRGVCNTVLVRARDGRWVRFPATALRAHVIGHGVYGAFALRVADGRLTAMERLR